jgi:hypothetical protein
MAQANPDNSTTMPVVSTRRRFLSQAAGVAAGGSILALATIPPASAAAAPMAALAASEVDPIFALIEDYRAAAETVAAAASEVSRREEMLIEQGLGTYPVICVLDAAARGKPMPTMAYSHVHIDQLLPPDRFSKANAEAKAALDVQIERNKAAVGDSEDVLYAAQDAETEAVDTLIWTVPTTIAGVLALLELCPELRRSRVLDDDQANAILVSVADALRDLHPLVTMVDPAAVQS